MTCLLRCLLLVALMAAGGARAQDGTGANVIPREALTAEAPVGEQLDYAAWDALADRAEAEIAAPDTSPLRIEQLRAQIADWRSAFLAAQGVNATRIATLRGQIAALGPVPTDGQPEAEEIATRRRDLTEQLVRLQAPVIAAEEAYSRADGIIREIDSTLRERQAAELLRLWPAPVNPQNWPAAVSALAETTAGLWQETAANAAEPRVRQQLVSNLPLILGLAVLAVLLLWRGRRWFERWPQRLQERASTRGAEVWAFFASLGQIVVPVAGVVALSSALVLSGLPGPMGEVLVEALPLASFTLFAGRWMGFRVFPRGEPGRDGLHLPPERRREGRWLGTGLGFLLAVESLRLVAFDPLRMADAAQAVLAMPTLVLTAVLLFRLGQLLRASADAPVGPEGPTYRDQLMRIMGSLAVAAAVVGPLLAAVGYVSAGMGLVYPAVRSLALVALVFTLQKLVRDTFALVMGDAEAGRDALLPVLIGFLLTLAAIPFFVLIWGARTSDLTEVFTRLREGFQLGQTRISPSEFLIFAVVFGLGWALTRLLQGALKATVLPRTRMDQGGQNAVAAGVGYVGIFLAALVAINTTGIDLSGLAIVAGALSVGIGFGLQNIVSNFVSGIILLIERPVSEGDWIEVGGVQGRVRAISVRSTRIETFDRTDVIVPNTDLIAKQVTNWTRFNLTGRVIVPVSVGIGSDMGKVEAILREVAEAQPLVILNPPPVVLLMGWANNMLNYEVRVILRDVNFSASVRSAMNREILRRLLAERIVVPPGRAEMLVYQGGPLPAPPKEPPKDPA